jgi:hypothetical protein
MTTTYNKQVLLKRGNTAVSSAYTGPVGEVTVDTDLDTIRVHDGITPGGYLATSSYSGTTPPGSPRENMLWYDTTGGRLYVYYSGAWIDASPAGDQELNANVAHLSQSVANVELHITSLDANIGTFETAVSDTFNNFINSINANIGTFETLTNNHVQSLSANIGTFETTVTGVVNTINSNINAVNETIMGFEANAGPTSTAWTSDNPPVVTNVGALWYDDVGGRLYVRFNNTWVDASPMVAVLKTRIGNVYASGAFQQLNIADDEGKLITIAGGNSLFRLPQLTADLLGSEFEFYFSADAGQVYIQSYYTNNRTTTDRLVGSVFVGVANMTQGRLHTATAGVADANYLFLGQHHAKAGSYIRFKAIAFDGVGTWLVQGQCVGDTVNTTPNGQSYIFQNYYD